MQTYRPTAKEWEKCLTPKERAKRKKRRKKLTRLQRMEKLGKDSDRYHRRKLRSQGLWDESNNTSTLVVTRISPIE